ncbi:MAG: FprA family A-type flavoprotein [Armatimonadetes bacterium]|nr:FprA family A-type flavoprotein [Armatimonadota bacterium]
MLPVEIAPGIHWVGALDPQIRIFDVIMHAPRGTTYNSYLIQGEQKSALVEVVKRQFTDVLLDNVGRVMDIAGLSYVVVNHTEPDHSGALDAVLRAAGGAQVVCARNARRFLEGLLNRDCEPLIVGDEDVIDLGGRRLRFIIAPFLHWPDTMFTYLEPDGILFPCDFLGAHYCDDRLFNDLVADYSHEFRYYFNVIMRPFKQYALQALDKVAALDVRMVCPSHGPIIRRGVEEYLDLYRQWATQPEPDSTRRLLVFYASSYGNTARMAEEIAEGARQAGMSVALFDLSGVSAGDVIDQLEAADAVAVGSLTINGDAVKPVWDLLSSLATLNLRGKVGAAFGSYGWSGEAPKFIAQRLADLKMKVVGEPVTAHLVPTESDLASCRQLGTAIAEAVSSGK